MSRKRKTAEIVILGVTVILSAISCFLLPDTVAVQWNASGPSNFMSKYFAVLLPAAVCLLIILSWNAKSPKDSPMDYLWGLFSCTGIIVDIVMLILN